MLKCLKTNDRATAVTIVASQPSPLEGSRGSETAEMLQMGLCLVETNEKSFLWGWDAESDKKSHCWVSKRCSLAFPPTPSFNLGPLAQEPRSPHPFLCTTQESGSPLPTHLGEDWSSHCGKKLNIRQISKSMSYWDFQRSKTHHIFLPNPPSFQVRKRAGVHWWEKVCCHVAVYVSQVCSSIREHQTVSKTHSHQRLGVAGFGLHRPLNHRQYIANEQPVKGAC